MFRDKGQNDKRFSFSNYLTSSERKKMSKEAKTRLQLILIIRKKKNVCRRTIRFFMKVQGIIKEPDKPESFNCLGFFCCCCYCVLSHLMLYRSTANKTAGFWSPLYGVWLALAPQLVNWNHYSFKGGK